ncbi:small ubiquitin-related modifier 2 isoform X2 [Capsicum chacoense]
MGGDKRKKRPFEEPSEQILINLRIKSQDGTVLYYTVKPTSSMKTLFKSYAKKKQIIDYKTIRFLYNGERLSSRKTVNQVGLEDDDEIDAMLHQHGGGSAHYY